MTCELTRWLVVVVALDVAACARAGFRTANGIDRGGPDLSGPDLVAQVIPWSQSMTVGEPQALAAFNTPDREQDPTLSPDGLTLFFVRGATLYQASRPALAAPFGSASPSGIATGNPITGHIHLASSGLLAVTHASWSGSVGLSDIWIAARSSVTVPFSSWSHVTGVATATYEFDPHLAPDGLTLWFQSGASPSFTLYRAERADTKSAFAAPVALSNLATTPDAQSPSLTDDLRTLVFAAHSGQNGYDIYFATRGGPDKPFGPPQRVPTVNSTANELEPFVRRDGGELFFTRDESGAKWQLYRASVTP